MNLRFGFIGWSDGRWDPAVGPVGLSPDGTWELKLQIIATYEDPSTHENKNVEQKIIIQMTVKDDLIRASQGANTHDTLDMVKDIIITPHPAQLHGNMDISIHEAITSFISLNDVTVDSATGVFITELTLAKPSGQVIGFRDVPFDVTTGPGIISFTSGDSINWKSTDSNIDLDEAGLWQLHMKIVAFYKDGTMAIKKIDQTLWIDFNVIPESAIGSLALIATSLGGFVAFRHIRKHKSDGRRRSGSDLGI